MIAAVRSARTLNVMTKDEGDGSCIGERRRYFKVNNGKANLVPPTLSGTAWLPSRSMTESKTVDASVSVVAPWAWRDPFDNVTVAHLRQVQERVAAGRCRHSAQAVDRVRKVVAEVLHLNFDDPAEKSRIRSLLQT